jgi:hypothetical protein
MRYLVVAVVAFNYPLSCRAIRILSQEDGGKIKKVISKTSILMEDGTVYKCFSSFDCIAGHRVDQLIIVDDERWSVMEEQWDVINQLKCAMTKSCVPEDYKIQKYKW